MTDKGKSYYTYTYLGRINGFKKVKIIMSCPENALWNKHALKCFISLDTELSTKQILNHYLKRWPIEAFFRETKRRLGFDKYQIHTIRRIKRYMYLLMLCYLYCELEVQGMSLGFSKGLKQARNELKRLEITWIYEQAIKGISIQNISKNKLLYKGKYTLLYWNIIPLIFW
ncbi:transposase, partial [Cellulosilyticum ruminicola]|uniref:transposase n=1 Tax=Cellulosilyticum ruminicola TaxID=425254 RepID=UPI0012EE4E3A